MQKEFLKFSFTKEKLKFEPDPYALNMIGLFRNSIRNNSGLIPRASLVFFYSLMPPGNTDTLHHSCASKCNHHQRIL
jgi:hypothetical protein